MYELELIAAISALLAGWYFVGSHMNRKLVSNLWKAVLDQMEGFAPKLTTRELGGSAFIAVAERPYPPFKRIEMAFTCLPREILINYLVSRAMGRRDLLTIVADLRSPPEVERGRGDFPDLEGHVLSLRVGSGRPNLRVIMSAEQALSGSVERVLSAVRSACGGRPQGKKRG